MKIYTAFCRDVSGEGTTWIDTVTASNIIEAEYKAKRACAHDWMWSIADVKCIGIARGYVEIEMWDDSE